jgi:hypothetical protein
MNVTDVYIIFGQSNADGREASPANPEAEVDGTLTGLQMYNAAANAFQPWKIGTNTGSFVAGNTGWDPFGLALKYYRDFLGVDNLYAVKATKGGISLHPTATLLGSFYTDTIQVVTSNRMWDMLVTRIEAVRYVLARQGKVARFKAALFHQGEGDKGAPYNAAWQANAEDLFLKLRQRCWNATMPIIAGTIPTAGTYYDATVQAAMEAIAVADANFHLVDLSAQPTFDGAHFNSVGKEFFADEVYEILQTL